MKGIGSRRVIILNTFSTLPGIFLCSPRHGELLALQVRQFGYDPYVISFENLQETLVNSSISTLIIDCRGALPQGLSAVLQAAEVINKRQGALLVLLQRSNVDALESLYQAGATHFLVAPFEDIELSETIRFILRNCVRLVENATPISVQDVRPNDDPLTGLATEETMREWLNNGFISASSEQDFSVAAQVLILVSLSRFDRVNTAYGRRVANGLLLAVSKRLIRLMTSMSNGSGLFNRRRLARFGGAEFGILLEPPLQLKDAVFNAQQIANLFERPFVVDGNVIHVACRIGLAMNDTDICNADTLIRQATHALSAAQTQAPNSFVVYQSDLVPIVDAQAELERDLRIAITTETLSLAYQPQVQMADNNIIGMEALVRWNHQSLGPISPDTLLMVAEKAEIMTVLGTEILKRALREAKQWPQIKGNSFRLAVNVAAVQLKFNDFEHIVQATLSECDFDPHHLTLEITESAIIDDVQNAIVTIKRLKAIGVRVAIDDFGTGHASYAYLKSLPFDYLKIDQGFIKGLANHRSDRAMVRSIIEMARTLGMSVIAEGVETEQQLHLLSREGCTAWQGYLCAEPMPGDQVAEFINKWMISKKTALNRQYA